MIFGLVSGPLFGVAIGLVAGRYDWYRGFIYGRGAGLGIGLGAMGVAGLRGGLLPGNLASTSLPNQGIWRSARSALWGGFGSGAILAIGAELIARLANRLSVAGLGAPIFADAWKFGLIAGLLVGLHYGGFACIRHAVLRLLLWRSGAMPWDYAAFLDYAAGRAFLRKVGGGYIFVHRMLLEYFAAMPDVQTARVSPAPSPQPTAERPAIQ